jgi:hypothetical protein
MIRTRIESSCKRIVPTCPIGTFNIDTGKCEVKPGKTKAYLLLLFSFDISSS